MTDHDHRSQNDDDAATMQSLSVMRMYHAGLMDLKESWRAHREAKQQLKLTYNKTNLQAVAAIETAAGKLVLHLDKLDRIQSSLQRSKTSSSKRPLESGRTSSTSDSSSTPVNGLESPGPSF